jgi:hypothetical protein
MTADACRFPFFLPYRRQIPGRIPERTFATLLLILSAVDLAGCSMFQKSELLRMQKQRNAAQRYPVADWIERRDIAREIVRYYGKDKNDLVIGILTYAAQDPQPAVRIEAVLSLAEIKSAQSLPMIKKIALEDRDDNVKWYAIKALRTYKDPSTADIFILGLGSNDWLIREESIKGICSLDDMTIRAMLIPYIIKAINDPSSSVMLTALRWVKTKDDRLYAVIAEKLKNSTKYNYSLIEASLIALSGYQLDPKTNEKVIGLLVHDNPRIRILALRVLKKERTLVKPE